MDSFRPIDPRLLVPKTPKQWFADIAYTLREWILPLLDMLNKGNAGSITHLRTQARLLGDATKKWLDPILEATPEYETCGHAYVKATNISMQAKRDAAVRLADEADTLDADTLLLRLQDVYLEYRDLMVNIEAIRHMGTTPSTGRAP